MGIFATCFIAAGTVIFQDRSIMVFNKDPTEEQIQDAYDAL